MRPFVFGIALALATLWVAPLRADWYTDCAACEAHLGGNSKIGPFATQSECESARQVNLNNHYPYRPCYQEGGDASGGASDDSLQQATSKALAQGLVNGDSQTFGVGLMGLGAMAMLNSGNSQPSQADLEAQRQAERQRQERIRAAAAAEAERKRLFEADKQEGLQDLKGGAQEDDGDDLKDLKDAPNDPPKKKKVKIIHLKPTEDVLHRPPLPGDSTKSDLFADWDDAKACGGTAGLDHASGKVACCPEGFPYFCGGRCYTEAALDNFRVPCDSTLKTLKQDLDLK